MLHELVGSPKHADSSERPPLINGFGTQLPAELVQRLRPMHC